MIHTAWAQVLLAQGARRHTSPLWIALGGAIATASLGMIAVLAAQLQWLPAKWAGLASYAVPLVLWQASACLLAACSHLPFQKGRASAFSLAAIGFDALQLVVLCAPLVIDHAVDATTHAWWLGGVSAAGLLALSAMLMRLRSL
jgi:hypothetical protein